MLYNNIDKSMLTARPLNVGNCDIPLSGQVVTVTVSVVVGRAVSVGNIPAGVFQANTTYFDSGLRTSQ